MGLLGRLLNLPAMLRYISAHRRQQSVWEPEDDLELTLYGSIFGNNFLHYGYFNNPACDPETLSFADLKRAMDDYATLLVQRVRAGERVLDVGCGMGGLLARLVSIGAVPTGLTPNRAHAAHIRKLWPSINLIESTFEQAHHAVGAQALKFDAIINSESFQYIDVDAGVKNVRALLAPAGRWLVIDYFRLTPHAKNRSGHLLVDFEAALGRHSLEIRERIDITENVLPSLAYGKLLATKFALPLARFGVDKYFRSRPLFAYLLADTTREKLDRVRLDTLDPDVFRREKRYLLMTLAAR